MATSTPAPLLRAAGLHKAYNVPVLIDFDFELAAGEIHALIGSNGAGKSTFARVVAGLTAFQQGILELDGRAHQPADKSEAERAGVVMVLQELNVIGALTVAENIFLDNLPSRFGFVQYR